jgi:hypothetical protein
MFNSVPGVPRAKVERLLLKLKLFIVRRFINPMKAPLQQQESGRV